jgi:hypothetical protein
VFVAWVEIVMPILNPRGVIKAARGIRAAPRVLVQDKTCTDRGAWLVEVVSDLNANGHRLRWTSLPTSDHVAALRCLPTSATKTRANTFGTRNEMIEMLRAIIPATKPTLNMANE